LRRLAKDFAVANALSPYENKQFFYQKCAMGLNALAICDIGLTRTCAVRQGSCMTLEKVQHPLHRWN
jgi:hypothetical protein